MEPCWDLPRHETTEQRAELQFSILKTQQKIKTQADKSCAVLKEITPSKSASVMLTLKSPFPLVFTIQKNYKYL